MYRGSRKHVIDWTEQPGFAAELAALVPIVPVKMPDTTKWMPRGSNEPAEARLENFGREWMPSLQVWGELSDWWLQHKGGANTPNWDIAFGCSIEERPGLILVEAKANWPELTKAGKTQPAKPSTNSTANHERIGAAIDQACVAWRRIDPDVNIKRDSHYQLANRLAFTWKLATLGIPVVLIYLGFTGDEGIRADAGAPFADSDDWREAFSDYAKGTIPLELFEKRIDFGGTPVWLASRSRAILEQSSVLQRGNG